MTSRDVDDSGTVTAETAVLLSALAALLTLGLWSVAAVGAQLRCVDASRTAARALARGETPGQALAAARALAPRGATATLSRDGNLAVVVVRVRFGLSSIGFGDGPALELRSRAATIVER